MLLHSPQWHAIGFNMANQAKLGSKYRTAKATDLNA